LNIINKNIMNNLSIIIPSYNESLSIKGTVENLKIELNKLEFPYEIIIVNDASTDDTLEIIKNIPDIEVVNHPTNKGYGGSLKSGVNKAKYEWVMFFDADGQHRPEYIPEFIKHTNEFELIAGDRSQGKYVRPTLRKPGLWLLQKIANYLVEYKIPDLNCGLRLIKKDALKKYLHLMPNGFSMSTTSTLAFLKDKRNVKFVPIEVNKRSNGSKSTVHPKDAATTMMLIFRLIMIFSPLRIFFPFSLIIFLIGFISLIYDLSVLNISETTIFILLTSILIFFFGLVSDQIAAIRREINK